MLRTGISALFSPPSGFLGHQSGLMAENNDGDESAQQQQHRACKRAFKSPLRRYGGGATWKSHNRRRRRRRFFLYGFWTASVKTREPSLDCEDNIPMSKKREREREGEGGRILCLSGLS